MLQAAVEATGRLGFRDAIDRAAVVLPADGWAVNEVKHCTFAGQDPGGNMLFQLVVVASDTDAAS